MTLKTFVCVECGEEFSASATKQPTPLYDSARCRKRGSRRAAGSVPPFARGDSSEDLAESDVPARPDPALVVAIKNTLEAAGQLETWEGLLAVEAARKIASAATTASSTGSLMDKLTALMTRLTKDATPAANGRRPSPRGRWRQRVGEAEGGHDTQGVA